MGCNDDNRGGTKGNGVSDDMRRGKDDDCEKIWWSDKNGVEIVANDIRTANHISHFKK